MLRRYLNSKLNNLLVLYLYLTLSIVAGIRYYVGTDFQLYQGIYNNSNNIKYSSEFVEIGYIYINRMFYNFNLSFQFFLIIVALFINFNFIRGAYKYTNDVIGVLFFFVTTGIYFSTYNIMRQSIVVSILFICFSLFIKKRYTLFVAIMGLSFLIHRSIFIVLIILAVSTIKLRVNPLKFFLWSLAFVTLFVNFSSNNIVMKIFYVLPDKYQMYSSSIGNIGGINYFNLLLPSILLILVFIFYKKLISKNAINKFFVKIFFVFYLLLIISTKYLDFYRVAAYFEISQLILIPEILMLIKLKEKWFIDLCVVIVFSVFIISKLILGHYGVVPYNFSTDLFLNK
ncbi:EpsG family protein [Priestia aryabhattai]|uniref:EpsG family protein n=1 Tax=Priestia aryabhattai TaxID=412384 RepID=UPI003364C5CE